jgi:hypothetical protein
LSRQKGIGDGMSKEKIPTQRSQREEEITEREGNYE